MYKSIKSITAMLLIVISIAYSSVSFSHYDRVDYSQRDPLEKINRVFFSVNYLLDQLILRPIAKLYKNALPIKLQKGIDNIYNNFGELRNAVNFGLQADSNNMINAGKRFFINSTVGVLGIVDVATDLGYQYNYNSFGRTIFSWTGKDGIYLELPLLSSATFSSAIGKIADAALLPEFYLDKSSRYIPSGIKIINKRSKFIGIDKLIYGDKYRMKRNLYLNKRYADLHPNDEIEDDF
jgi:phospholipid-binding lipoprotein MlaA